MNLSLTGKTALVCGASQGLGLATAKELALLGATVILMARNEQRLIEAVSELNRTNGQEHRYLVADFSDSSQVQHTVNNFLSENNTVHILVNNSGGPPGGDLLLATPADFEKAFQQHLICNHLLAQAVIPGMKKSGYGRIVNIISTSVKEPIPGLAVSNTIRGAVASWSKTLANEVGPFNITVNNLLPGYTRTARFDAIVDKNMATTERERSEIEKGFEQQIPLRRIGTVEEFGAAAAFLCSPAASYITGINLPVDGGRLSCL